MQPEADSCPACGGALLPDAVAHGLCAACLMSPDAIDGDSGADGEGLRAGARLGPYEIVSMLGRGGMGDVYKAWDLRLRRSVAIKVLPAGIGIDARLTRRLEREARIVARLNHPHICAVHDIGCESGQPYIVMEHLEGETLAARLDRGPLAIQDAVALAIAIADGLDTAHRHGITHRDLKPSNIMVTASGAKVLDFGLASLRDDRETPAGLLDTLSAQDSVNDAAGGTVQYSAPEQLERKPSDARTDVFAFGLTLYAMLTARHAFTGDSRARVIAAVLASEPPPVSAFRADVPPALERIVARCLRKHPDERWQSLCDVRFELMAIGDDRPRRPHRAGRFVRLAAAVALAAAGLTILAEARSARPAVAPAMRFVEPSPIVGGSTATGLAVVSPDGRALVWSIAASDGKTMLALQRFDTADGVPLAGTEGASGPFWSPDSRGIGFFAQGSLKKVSASGGPVDIIAPARSGAGGTWSRNGVIVFAPERNGALFQVPASGGTPAPVTALDRARSETAHQWPAFLPDGRHFVYFAAAPTPEHRGLLVGAIDSRDRRWLGAADGGAAYAAPGFLLFARGRTLFARPFDAFERRFTGEAAVLEPHIFGAGNGAPPYFSASDSGLLVYHVARLFRHQLAWFDRAGRQIDVPIEPGSYFSPVLSADGSRVAVERHDPATWELGVWLFDLHRRVFSRLASDPAVSMSAVWAPDGRDVAFAGDRNKAHAIYKVSAQGGGAEPLLETPAAVTPTDWSPDGRLLLYQLRRDGGGTDVWTVATDATHHAEPYLQSAFNKRQARFAPNGRWVAYSSDESGRFEVYVQPFPATGARWQISSGGGREPSWRRNGRELFYLSADRRLVSVPVDTAGTFRAGAGVDLFRVPSDAPVDSRISYAVAADAQRFLLNVAAADRVKLPPFETDVVVNWPATLRR